MRFFIVICSLLASGAGEVSAKGEMDLELRADYVSKYIWRGQNAADNPVFQPSISLGYQRLTASVWGNLELTGINGNNGEFSELDYTLDYSGKLPSIEKLGYSIGTIFYDFPLSETKDTSEVYWGLTADLPFSPSITVYHDLDEADGTYLLLGAGHRIEKIAELAPGIPVATEIGATLGWGSRSYNRYYWGTEQSKLNDLLFSASFPFEVGGWTVTPSVNYVTLVSDDIRDTDVYGTDSDFFFVGIGLLKRF